MGKDNLPPKIIVPPPGPKAREILKRDLMVISPSYVRYYPLVVERVEQGLVIDVDGNVYIDFNSGLLCLNLSRHPRVVEAIKRQVDKLIHYSLTDFYYEEAVSLAEKLAEITPVRGEKKCVHFSNSGTEAVEAALKLARWSSKRQYFVAYIGAFHGRTYGSMSLTASKPVQRKGFSPLLPGVVHVPYPYCYRCPFKLTYPDCNLYCIDFIEEHIFSRLLPPEEVAAIVFEPVQGEGGYVWASPGYFERLRKLADKYGILLIDDEVQAGMGRTGKWFAIEHWDAKPDIITIAKSIASGLPLGATVSSCDVMRWEKGSHATTFGGNPVACAAALETIRVIEEERLLERATRLGEKILKRFNELKEEIEIIGDVRGKGLMIGVEIVKDKKTKRPGVEEAKEIMMRSWRRGVAIITAGISTLRIAPPLIIPEEYLERGLSIVEDVIREVATEQT